MTYLAEAADDIAYMTGDLEDAVKSELASVDELLRFFNTSIKELSDGKEKSKYIGFTKEIIEKLDKLNREEKDKAKVMGQWGSELRLWLMYVTYSDGYLYSDNHCRLYHYLQKWKRVQVYLFDRNLYVIFVLIFAFLLVEKKNLW